MWRFGGALVLAALISLSCTCARASVGEPTQSLDPTRALSRATLGMLLQADQPIERQVSGFAKSIVREVRRSFRILSSMFGRAMSWWGNWIKRAAFYVFVAIVAALADASMVNAWRLQGIRVLATYVPMMLYVYARLLFSSGVSLAPKLVLAGTIIYGMVWRDLLPDRRWIPGRLEDILLIVIATRAFVYACPEELVNQYAERAVHLRRRMLFFQRARTR